MKLIDELLYYQAMEANAQKAIFALGRLSEAFSASPLGEAWAARARIEAVIRVLHADGFGIDRERVLRLSYDLPVGGRIDIGSHAQVLQIIAFLGSGSADGSRDGALGEDLGEAEAMFLSGAETPGPETLLRHLWRWLAAGRRPSIGHIAFVRCLATAGMTPGPLGVLARPSGPARQGERTWVQESLLRLADAADGARRDLEALALTVVEWRRRLGRRRSHSRMDALIHEVASSLVVTPASVARRHELSLRGASVMLEELAELGIVVEITGRKSWKIFVPSDLVVSTPGKRNRRPEIQPMAPASRAPDLGPLLDETASAVVRVQAAMERLRRGRGPVRAAEGETDDDPAGDHPPSRS